LCRPGDPLEQLLYVRDDRHHFTSSDLISSELSGCEATQFAVAVTNQNSSYWTTTCLRRVTRVVTGFTVGLYVDGATCCVPIGRSHGELGRCCTEHSAEMR